MAITLDDVSDKAAWYDYHDSNFAALDSIDVTDLTDTNISSPPDGHALLSWDTGTSKWVDSEGITTTTSTTVTTSTSTTSTTYTTTTVTTTTLTTTTTSSTTNTVSTTTTTQTLDPASYAWDPSKVGTGMALSNSNRTCTASSSATGRSVISDWDKSSGKWYWELELTLVGNYSSFGVCDQDTGTDFDSSVRSGWNESWAYLDPSDSYHDGALTGWGVAVSDGDILMIALDLDNNKIFVGVNGTWMESGDPAAGTGYMYNDADIDDVISACATLRYSGDAVTVCFNASQQTYSAPSGFSALGA